MAITVSELRAQFTADDAPFRATAGRVSQHLSAIERAIQETTAAIQSLGQKIPPINIPPPKPPDLDPIEQAFKQLGIASQKSLEQAANEAKQSFDVIARSGQASAEDIVRAQAAVDAALAKTKAATDPVENAFKQLGIESQKALEKTANEAKQAYDTIAKSGKASSEDLVRAQKAVDAALAKTRIEAEKVPSAFDKMREAGRKLESIGTTLSIAVTAPLVLLGKKISDVGREYEQAMNTFQAVTRASAAEMERAAQVAQQLGADMSLPATSAGDAALAMTELAKAGFTATEAMDAARGVLQLAAAAQIEEARAAEIAANAINAFGLAASDATRVADLLAAAANASSAEITDIAAAMQQSAASAHALKIPIEDLVTGLGLMANAGIKGSDAGTSFKVMLTRLNPETDKAAKAMAQLGIDAFDAQGKFIGLEAVIRQAAPALAKMTDEQRQHAIQVAFGTDGMRAANIVLGQGVEKYNSMSEAVGRSGAAAELAGAKTKGLAGAWDGLISQLETVALKIFVSVSGGLENIVRKAADMIGALGNLDSSVLRFGVTVAAVAAAGGPIALMIGKLAQLTATGAIITGVIAGVALLAAAYVENYAEMGDAVDAFFRNLIAKNDEGKKSSGEFVRFIKEAGLGLGQAFDFILTTIAAGVSAVVSGLKQIWLSLQLDFEGVMQEQANFTKNWDRMWAEFGDRTRARSRDVQEIIKSGTTETTTWVVQQYGKTGDEASRAFTREFKAQNPVSGVADQMSRDLAAAHPGIVKKFGILGTESGQKFKGAWRSETTRSPFFIIGEVLDAIAVIAAEAPPRIAAAGKSIGKALKDGVGNEKILERVEREFIEFPATLEAKVAPRLKNASKQMVRDMREAFEELLQAVNDWAKDIGVAVNITAEVWAKMSKETRKAALDMAKAAKESKDQITQALADTLPIVARARDAFADYASRSIKGMEGLNLELAKNGATWRGWDADVKNTIQTTRDMEAALAKVPNQMRALGTAALDAGKDLKSLEQITKELNATMGEMVKQATRSADAIKYSAEQIPGFEQAMKKGEKATEELTKEQEKLRQAMEEVSRRIPESVNRILDAFGNLSLKTKSIFADIFDIIGLLPGKVGSTLQKAVNEFERWFQLLDKVIRVVEKVFGENETEGIIGIIRGGLSAIGGLFKKTFADELPQATVTVGTVLDGLGIKFGDFANKATQATSQAASSTASAATAMSSSLNAVLGIFGALTAAVGVFASTFQSDSKAIRFAGGFLLGGPVGGILSAIFGGPSDFEKRKRELQLERMRLENDVLKKEIEKQTQEIFQSALETVKKAVEAFEKVADFAGVPKKAIQMLFAALRQTMNQFVQLSKQFSQESLEQAKQVAESLSAVVDLIGGAVSAFEGLRDFRAIPERAISALFSALNSVIDKMGEIVEEVELKLVKRASKYAAKLKEVVSLISEATDAFKKVVEFEGVPKENLQRLFNAIQDATNMMGQIVEQVDRIMVNKSRDYARNIKEVISLISEAADAFNKLKEFVEVPKANLQLLFEGIEQAAQMMIAVAGRIREELLSAAVAAATDIREILSILQEATESFKAIAAFEGVPAENMQRLFDAIVATAQWAENIVQQVEESLLKKSVKYGVLIVDVIGHLRDAAEIFNTIRQFQNIPAEQLKALLDAIEQAITHLANMADSVDKKMLKAARKFADLIASVMESLLRALQSFNELANVATNPASVLQAVLTQFEAAVELVEELANRASEIQATMVAAAEGMAASVATFGGLVPTTPEGFPSPFTPVPEGGTFIPSPIPAVTSSDFIQATSTTAGPIRQTQPVIVEEKHYHFHTGAIQINPETVEDIMRAAEWSAEMDRFSVSVRTTRR